MTRQLRGCGSPVVKVSNHGRHVMSSVPVPLKTRRVGQRCTLNLSRAETSSRWCGVVVRRGGASSGVVHLYRIAIAIIKILGQTVKTFGFPKEDFFRKKWIQAISRKDFVPSKYSKVCGLHFSDDAIRRYTKGGYILGMAYNSKQAATSAYVFLIQCLLSPLKEVVHIMPGEKIDGEKLFAVKKTIVELDDI
ncbi:uncharacterized protein TNCV_3512421 [Trichonephila clavipes]|nr:uncharacterized protein TNCV_3512421 [Trichonephila clavipes]